MDNDNMLLSSCDNDHFHVLAALLNVQPMSPPKSQIFYLNNIFPRAGDVNYNAKTSIQIGTFVRMKDSEYYSACDNRLGVVVGIDDYHDHDHVRYQIKALGIAGNGEKWWARGDRLEIVVGGLPIDQIYPHGTEIITVEVDVEPIDLLENQRIGARGIIIRHNNHRGLCYQVVHGDGELAWYVPEQLELFANQPEPQLEEAPEESRKLDLGEPIMDTTEPESDAVEFLGGWGPASEVEEPDLDDNPVPLPEAHPPSNVLNIIDDASFMGSGDAGQFTKDELDDSIRDFLIDYMPPTSQLGDLAYLVGRISHMIRLRWNPDAQE